MKSISSSIQAIDAARDIAVNLSGAARVLGVYSSCEGDDATAMLSFVIDAQVERMRALITWLEASSSQDSGSAVVNCE